jgi:hypothetical protein
LYEHVFAYDARSKTLTAKNERPAAKRFTPELIAEAAKLRESGMTWDKIGEQLDVRSTGLLSKRVREAAPQPASPSAKPARSSATPTPKPRPRKAASAPKKA